MATWTLLLPLLLVLGSYPTCGAQGMPRRKYLCPPNFVRHGNSCYFFSVHMASWFDAHFDCKDRNSELAILEKGWEDRNMRTYLNKPELARLERWIGGIYNWEIKRWVWGANGGNPLKYRGFSQMPKNSEQTWNCIIMDPSMSYKWSSRSCINQKHYICEVPLKRLKPPQPHATQPNKPKKNKDPNRMKKPRDPSKKNKDPNKRQRRKGWRQRQQLRQQQRAMSTRPPTPPPVQTTTTTALPTTAYDNPPTRQTQYHSTDQHHAWGGHQRLRFVHLPAQPIRFQEEVLI